MQAIAEGYGVAAILGAQIVGGAVAVLVGLFVKKLRRLFPPLITGTVVFTIGPLALSPPPSTTWPAASAAWATAPGRTGWWPFLPWRW